MTHYVKEKYNKKITLFSQDAVKTPDSSGSKYEWFSWNNIKNLGLLPDTKMKVGSIDFKNVPLIDVDIQAPVPPDDLVVHYKFDGDVVEEVQNTPTTIIGTAVYGVGKKFDNNAYFNTSWACSIDAADNPLTSVTNAITICAWIKMDSLVREHIIRKELCYVIRIGSNGSPGVRVVASIADGTQWAGATEIISGTELLTNTWYHIAITYDFSNTVGSFKCYVNGVLDATPYRETYNNAITSLADNTEPIYIGQEPDGNKFDGYIEDFRIYNRVLSSDEVNRIMAEIQKDPVVHYKFENNLVDETGNTTLNGDTPIFDTPGKHSNYSFHIQPGEQFNITNTGGNNILGNLSQFTISFWLKWTDTTDAVQHFIQQHESIFFRKLNTTQIQIGFWNGAAWKIITYPYVATSFSYFHHLSWVVNLNEPDSTKSKVFINGASVAPTILAPATFPTTINSTEQFNIFWGGDYNPEFATDGNFDDFRIYDKALDAKEVREVMWENRGLYMWYKFEPTIKDSVANNDLLLHLEFENLTNVNDNVIIDSTGRNSIVSLSGQTYTGLRSTDRKRGNYSFYGGLLDPEFYFTNNQNVIPNGTKQLTVAFWIKPTSTTGQFIMRCRPNTFILSQQSTYNFAIIQGNTNLNIISTYAPTLNTWEHIAITLDYTTSTYETFKNGVKDTGPWTENSVVFDPNGFENTTASSTDVSNGMFGLFMNAWTNGIQHFEGYCDDFRIYSKALTEDEIQSLYSKYLTFQDGMYNTIMNDTQSGFEVSTVNKVGNYALDLSGGIKGGSITLTDGDVNVFQNLQRITFCFWSFLRVIDHQYNTIFYQSGILHFFIDKNNMSFIVVLGGQIMTWDLTSFVDIWKHYTVVIDYSETDPLQKVLLFINGVSQGTGSKSGTDNTDVAYPATTDTLCIGSHDGTQLGFDGYIDDVRIYTTQLDTYDINLIVDDIVGNEQRIQTIRCSDCYDTYESDNNLAMIYHNKGIVRNKKVKNPAFKVRTPLESISLKINHINANEKIGLTDDDEFVITLLAQNEEKEIIDGNIEEDYHKYPQNYITYK